MVAKGDENALKEAVYKHPVMVGVDAGHASFQVARILSGAEIFQITFPY